MNHITYIHKHKDTIRSIKTAAVMLLTLLVSCGGGGGDSAPQPTYDISGTVTGAPNVTITLNGLASKTTITDPSGNYSFTGIANGSYTVTPSVTWYAFNPPSQTVIVSGATVTDTNFSATKELFVTDYSDHVILVYAKNADGDIAPARSIAGSNTGLYTPSSVKLDTLNNEIFAVNQFYDLSSKLGDSITVYSGDAVGNATPIRTIAGAKTRLLSDWTRPPGSNPNGPSGMIIDNSHNEIIVVNAFTHSILFFDRNANGDISPIRTISGPATGLDRPLDLFLDAVNDEIFVSNFTNNSITVYSRTGSGDVAPLRTIIGAATKLDGPLGIIVDNVSNEIIVANYVDTLTPNSYITTYPRLANGDIPPKRTISGPDTGLDGPLLGISLDTGNDELAAAVRGSPPSIRIFNKTDVGNTPPKRTIVGPATQLKNPWGVAVIP